MTICSVHQKASADSDYYDAQSSAERAETAGEFDAAAGFLKAALQKYPGDFELTLKLALAQFRGEHFADALQSYQLAAAVSDGAIEPRVGAGWALIQLERCEEGVRVLQDVLAEEPRNYGALSGLAACAERGRWHGSVWLGLGGQLYQGHVWKRASGDGSLGLQLLPAPTLLLGAAYHFLALTTHDHRVPGLNQHELYLHGGYSSPKLIALLHGAWVWGGDAITAGSSHANFSLRVRGIDATLEELGGDVTASHYQDLWVARLALSLRLALGQFHVTPNVAVEQFARRTLASAAIAGEVSWGIVSLWVGGKYGTEYRAAYLSQFALFNSDEYARWSASGGVRYQLDEHWSWVAQYAVIGTRSIDGLDSAMHILSVTTVYQL